MQQKDHVGVNGRKFPEKDVLICYEGIDGLVGDPKLYGALAESTRNGSAKKIKDYVIPPRDAIAVEVKAGQMFRITCPHGPQVADLNVFNLHNPREKLYTSKTRQLHASHITAFDRLWSGFPYLRPLATITYDTISYGIDKDGAGVHDLIGSRCDPYTNRLLTNEDFHRCCHSNLTRAVAPYHLTEFDVHDVLNVFMCTGFTLDEHKYFCKASPVRAGDYLEFFAEIDLLVACSACPQGDVSIPCGSDEEPTCYPLGISIYEPPKEIVENSEWSPPQRSEYKAAHGLALDTQSKL